MSGETEARIVALEELTAHQGRMIEDLSGQIAEQWKLIDRLRKRLDDMVDQFEELEDRSRAQQPTQKPPHW